MAAGFSISYRIFWAAAFVLQIFTFSSAVAAQEKVRVEIRVDGSAKLEVHGRSGVQRTLSFVKNDMGFSGLAGRVSEIQLTDAGGNAVAFKEPIPGEVVADGDFVGWSYLIDLSPKREQTAAAHISWMTNDSGLLMLGDMLPVFSVEGKPVAASVKLVFSNGWRSRVDLLETMDAASEVVVVGRRVEFWKLVSDAIPISVATYCTRDACDPVDNRGNDRPVDEGTVREWHFTREELDQFSTDIYKSSRDVFGGDAQREVYVNLFRFPFDPKMNPGSWQAETRGNNITIISSDMAFRTQSVQRLHEQLRHEMLHLWIPNGVALTGKYDWFYEGFVLYQALKIGVATNRISFDNYLDTLSRAKAIEARYEKRGSLIEASNERWRGAETYIYAKGMLTAFLCDVAMLDASGGKRSVENIFRSVYAKHKKGSPATDGNQAVLEVLRENRELVPITDRYITGGQEFNWDSYIDKAGLEFVRTLQVKEKPAGRQKRILDALGYNNWRNIRR